MIKIGIYIGSDTQTIEYDFGLKVANSVAETPMRIFKGEVDPSSLPTPTDPLWKEITSQTILDKLKVQNELSVSAIATDKSSVTWNNRTLSKTSTVKVLDDFAGKISGSVVENPHINKALSTLTALGAPSQFTSEVVVGYGLVSTLNGSTAPTTSNASGQIPQQLFSFNAVEMFERKFGAIPKETLAEKIDWLRNVGLKQIACNWTGYGVSPLGNKAYFDWWKTTGNYGGMPTTNTANSSNLCVKGIDSTNNNLQNAIDTNGFAHFLAYTDQARTTDSTLLVLTNHGLSNSDIFENTTRNMASVLSSVPSANVIITSSISGQVSGDSIDKYHMSSTKTAENGTDITTIKITNHGLSNTHAHYIKNITRNAIAKVSVTDANTLTIVSGTNGVYWTITGQTSGDNIQLYPYLGTQTAESTVISSTIYTDYVSLELTLKAPENLITATNTLSDIVTDFTGKTAGDTSSNANIFKLVPDENASVLQTPNGIWNEYPQNYIDSIKTLNGACASDNPGLVSGRIPQQLFSFNIVSAVEKQLGQPIPSVDKVQWCKDFMNTISCAWSGYGTCPSGNSATFGVWKNTISQWDTYKKTTTASSVTTLSLGIAYTDTPGSILTTDMIDSNGMVHFIAYTSASDGVTPSTIFTDYIKLTIKLKYIPTYDFYTDSNTRRDAGLTDIVLVKRSISDMVSDFTGKIVGSTVENPNNAYAHSDKNALLSPSNYSWNSQSVYDKIKTLNNDCTLSGTSISGNIPQHVFQFNLIAIAEKQLGTSIPGVDTATKIQWLSDNLASFKVDWYGFGSCPSGNYAVLSVWKVTNTVWENYATNTSSTPNLLTANLPLGQVSSRIDSNGFINALVWSSASDGTTSSVINTDYIKITLSFKTDTVGYEYFTNNSSEVSVTTVNKASSYLIELDLTPICNALFGGSNNALKSALKSISADIYAMGSGANVNQLGNDASVKLWSNDNVFTSSANNNTNSIVKINKGASTQTDSAYVTTSTNKIYIIVYSSYKSDGIIASEVNLDYVNIKVGITRTPDVISNPPTINLTPTWSMLIRGFSPSWDNTKSSNVYLIQIGSDLTNRYYIQWRGFEKCFRLVKVTNGASLMINQTSPIFSKYQIENILIIQTSNSLTFKILKNNGTVETYSSTTSSVSTGSNVLYILENNESSTQADAFLDSIIYLPNQTYDDTTAEAILRGTQTGFEFPELFDINQVQLHANATRSNGVITLNATGQWQASYLKIPVLPNNQYEFKVLNTNGWIYVNEFYNNINIRNIYANTGNLSSFVFTTGKNTNYINISLDNGTSTTGTFTWSNISLKLKM